jgi:two-component system, cell cycle sensor histidine kinase and response regulator CckA
MRGTLRILHLEDNPFDAELLGQVLKNGKIDATLSRVDTPAAFEALLQTDAFDLAICDYNVPGFSGFTALGRIRELAPDLPVIIVSGAIGDEQAVECLKHGATDYILKDRLHRLIPAIDRALHEAELKQQNEKAYRALRQSEERLSCVLLATNDAIYDWDLETNQIWWNNGLQKLFGHNPRLHKVHFKWWKSAIHPDDARGVAQSLENALHSQASFWNREYRFRCADGEYACVLDRGYILRDGEGKAIRVVGSMMDISERKRLEGEMLRVQRMDTIGAIAGGVAHDLNNMLSPILVASELLGDHVRSPETQPLLDMIKSSVQRGSELVRQILGFAQGVNAVQTPIDFSQFAKGALSLIRAAFPRNVTVELDVARDMQPFMAQPTQLHQVLLNLCVNARDAMPNGGKLQITGASESLTKNPSTGEPLTEPSHFAVISVSDTGLGIPREHLPRIFEPFFTTKRPGQGTGIGLSTVKQIMDAHGGFITVKSVVGEGTTFSLFFPALTQAAPPKAEKKTFEQLRGKKEVLLVVEDELSLAHLIHVALETHDYIVLPATSAEEALAVYRRDKDRIKLVIADWNLPGMGGLELLRQLRAENPAILTLSMTGASIENTAVKTEPVLQKPFSTEALLRTVQQTLEPKT